MTQDEINKLAKFAFEGGKLPRHLYSTSFLSLMAGGLAWGFGTGAVAVIGKAAVTIGAPVIFISGFFIGIYQGYKAEKQINQLNTEDFEKFQLAYTDIIVEQTPALQQLENLETIKNALFPKSA